MNHPGYRLHIEMSRMKDGEMNRLRSLIVLLAAFGLLLGASACDGSEAADESNGDNEQEEPEDDGSSAPGSHQ